MWPLIRIDYATNNCHKFSESLGLYPYALLHCEHSALSCLSLSDSIPPSKEVHSHSLSTTLHLSRRNVRLSVICDHSPIESRATFLSVGMPVCHPKNFLHPCLVLCDDDPISQLLLLSPTLLPPLHTSCNNCTATHLVTSNLPPRS